MRRMTIESDSSAVGVREWLNRLRDNAKTIGNHDLEQRCEDAIVCLSSLEREVQALHELVDRLRNAKLSETLPR